MQCHDRRASAAGSAGARPASSPTPEPSGPDSRDRERGRPVDVDGSEVGRRRLLRKAGLIKESSAGGDLVRKSRIEEKPRGRLFLQPGQSSENVYLVAKGRVRLARQSREGKEYLVSYRDCLDLVGEGLLFGCGSPCETAEAVEETALLAIPVRTLRKALDSDTAVASKILGIIARRRAEAEDLVERLIFRNVESRIAELILSLVEPYGRPDPRGTLITMKLTHAEVSRTVGSTRETVTLTLGALRRRGLIDFDRRRILIRDVERLRQLV